MCQHLFTVKAGEGEGGVIWKHATIMLLSHVQDLCWMVLVHHQPPLLWNWLNVTGFVYQMQILEVYGYLDQNIK